MAIIYRKSDRIKVKIHDIEVMLAPLTYHEKSEISKLMLEGKVASAAVESIKTCVKEVKGLKLADGSAYELEFENDKLSGNTIDDLMNLEHSKELILICLEMLASVPSEFIDAESGEPLKGVSIVKKAKSRKK